MLIFGDYYAEKVVYWQLFIYYRGGMVSRVDDVPCRGLPSSMVRPTALADSPGSDELDVTHPMDDLLDDLSGTRIRIQRIQFLKFQKKIRETFD